PSLSMTLLTHISTLFPYTTLFRSKIKAGFEMLVNNFSAGLIGFALAILGFLIIGPVVSTLTEWLGSAVAAIIQAKLLPLANIFRSEEHTSELQSRFDLVCRLLLEK